MKRGRGGRGVAREGLNWGRGEGVARQGLKSEREEGKRS